MKTISREKYLSAYRAQWPISLIQMALAVSLAAASVQFHARIGWIILLAVACLIARFARWLYIRPKIAARLADAGKPLGLAAAADVSFLSGTILFMLVIYLNWLWHGGWPGLLGVFTLAAIPGLLLKGFNSQLHPALRADSLS